MRIIVNLPNILSLLRILIVPIFIYLLIMPELWMRQIAFVLFCLAAFTDFIDGYIARKYRQETELGCFLDPLADKALVLATLLAFLSISEQVQIWMVLCIVGRDLLVTFLRWLAIKKHTVLNTSVLGKFKTLFQMFSICVVILSCLIVSYEETDAINAMYANEKANYGFATWNVASLNLTRFLENPSRNILFDFASFLPYYLMLMSTFITIVSGLRYLFTNYALLLPPWSSR